MSCMISAEAAVHFCWHRGPRCRRCCRAAQPAGDAGGVLRAAAPSAVPLRRRRAQPLCRCSGGGRRRRAHQAVPHLPHRAARGGQLHAGPAGALPCCCYAVERFSRRMHLKHGRAYSSHSSDVPKRQAALHHNSEMLDGISATFWAVRFRQVFALHQCRSPTSCRQTAARAQPLPTCWAMCSRRVLETVHGPALRGFVLAHATACSEQCNSTHTASKRSLCAPDAT